MDLFGSDNIGAVISGLDKYRYQLWRIWDVSAPKVLFIMLNPSTANADLDDPTIRRCISFTKSWGYGGLYVGNLFAYRATNPKELLGCDNPIGRDNALHISKMAEKCEMVLCAWGNSAIVKRLTPDDYKPLEGIKAPLYYIDLSKDGTPKHPLYLKGDLKPKPFNTNN